MEEDNADSITEFHNRLELERIARERAMANAMGAVQDDMVTAIQEGEDTSDIVLDEAIAIDEQAWDDSLGAVSTGASTSFVTSTDYSPYVDNEQLKQLFFEWLDQRHAKIVDLERVKYQLQQKGATMADSEQVLQTLNADVVKIGNDVFRLERVGTCENLIGELEDFYKNAADLHRQELVDEEREAITADARAINEHVAEQQRRRNSSQLTVPESFRVGELYVRHGELYEVRRFRHEPKKIDTCKYELIRQHELGHIPTVEFERIMGLVEDWETIDRNAKITFALECDVYSEMMVGKSLTRPTNRSMALFTGTASFHSMGDVVCIGRATVQQVWDMPWEEFLSFMNHINQFSLGRSEAYMHNRNTLEEGSIMWWSLINGTNGSVVSRVAGRGEGQWRA